MRSLTVEELNTISGGMSHIELFASFVGGILLFHFLASSYLLPNLFI